MTDAPPDGELVSRVAARVLLIDGADRLLLMRGFDPARPDLRYWFTVGGGLDEGETTLDAAVRELFEETGLKLEASELTGPVFHETTFFPFDNQWYSQEQDFFVARVDTWDADQSGFSDIERATIEEARWWPLADLMASPDKFYPANIVPLMRASLTTGATLPGATGAGAATATALALLAADPEVSASLTPSSEASALLAPDSETSNPAVSDLGASESGVSVLGASDSGVSDLGTSDLKAPALGAPASGAPASGAPAPGTSWPEAPASEGGF